MSHFSLYTGFTEAREGGLSKDKTDSASRYPVPDDSGYHTNKGITWQTFEMLSVILDYEGTPSNFYKMPDAIFNKIFGYFWNKSGANLVENQAIANLAFQALWGGGHYRLVCDIQKMLGFKKPDGDLGDKTAKVINNYADLKELYDKIHQCRLDYLRSLKVYKTFGKGWENRMKKLYKFNQQFL